MSKEGKEKEQEIDETTPLGRENENNRESTVSSYPPTNYYPPPVYGGSYQPPPGYYVQPGQQGYYTSSAPQPYYENPGQAYYDPNAPPAPAPALAQRDQRRVDLELEELIRKRSKQLYCPNCRRYGWSRVSLKNGLVNHLCCGYLCLIGCWLCCWIPYCCDECKDAEHFCEFCNTLLKQEHPL